MEVQQRDHTPVRYKLIRILADGFAWANQHSRDHRKAFKEEGLAALASADDEGNYELNGKKGTIKGLGFSGTGYAGAALSFKEFVALGRPFEITRERYSIYKPVKEEDSPPKTL